MPLCFFDAVPGMAYAACASKCTANNCKNTVLGGWKFCEDCSEKYGKCKYCGLDLENYPVTEERIREAIRDMEECYESWKDIYEQRGPEHKAAWEKERKDYLDWAERLMNERLKNKLN